MCLSNYNMRLVIISLLLLVQYMLILLMINKVVGLYLYFICYILLLRVVIFGHLSSDIRAIWHLLMQLWMPIDRNSFLILYMATSC